MFSIFSKYLVQFLRNGKVVSQEFCNTEEEIKVLRAVAHSKGCQCEVSCFGVEKPIEKVEPTPEPVEKKQMKRGWSVPCKCIESGKVYASVAECSRDTGIKKRALYNALVYGKPRKGLHFVPVDECKNSVRTNIKKKHIDRSVPYLCLTTGEIFNSVSDVFQKYNFSLSMFYRSIKHGKEIHGLRFKKLERKNRPSSRISSF